MPDKKPVKPAKAASSTGKHPGGRPTLYNPELHPLLARKYALLGLTGLQIAGALEVSEKTYENWKKRHKEFVQAIREGGAQADAHIASRLYERAEGYVCTVEQAFKIKTGKDTEDVKVVSLKQEVPPDTKAANLWLTNRAADRWRDKQVVQVEGLGGLVARLQQGRERANSFAAQAAATAQAPALAPNTPGSGQDKPIYGDD